MMDILYNRELYSAIIEEGILKAERSIIITTANLKNIYIPLSKRNTKSLVEVLIEMASNDVYIEIIHASLPSRGFQNEAERKDLWKNPNIHFFHCPRMHFKTVIIDEKWIYLGSANLTGAGFGAKSENKRNFELGFASAEKDLINNVSSQVKKISENEYCSACYYKKNCGYT